MLTKASGRRLHTGPDLVIREVACRGHGAASGWLCGGATPSLVLVRRGAFVLQTWDSPQARADDGAEYVADPCTALILWDHALHRVHHPCDDGDESLVIDLGAHIAADRLRGLCRQRDVALPLSPRLQMAIAVFAAGVRCRTVSSVAQAAVALVDAILDAARTASQLAARSKRRTAAAGPARHLALAAIAQIHSDLSTNRSIADLADSIGCSPFHLMHAFRAAVGDTVRAYRLRARLGAALHRLAQGHDDLSALAIELGFASHSHFTDTFARALGVSPSRLRAQLQEPGDPRPRPPRVDA